MTKYQIEKMAHHARENRYTAWMRCGTHNWSVLPVTKDSGDHYCIACYSLFSMSGALLNQPEKPADSPDSNPRS
jgi:hypothetical protein